MVRTSAQPLIAPLQQLGGERCAAVAQTTPANVGVMYALLDALPVYEAYATDVPMLVLDNAESLEATGLICMQSEFSYEEGQCEEGKPRRRRIHNAFAGA